MPPLNNFTKSCLAVAIGHAMASPVQAANIVVNSSYDTSAVDAECTLREAIVSANGNSAGGNGCVDGTPGLDTITFAGEAANNSYVRLEQGTELRITEELQIDGPADGQMSIYGDDADAVFLVDYAGTVEFNNLKIAYGESGIQINGSSLTLNDCTVSRNYAADGIAGGGISLVYSTLNLNRTTISNNYAGAGSDGGGGIFTKSSTVNIYNSTIVGNYADEYGGTVGEGGAILADDSTVNLVNSTITRNWGANTGGLLARNGGLMTLVNSIVSGNNAFYGAGGPTANGQEISALTYGLIAGEYNNLLGHSSKTNAMAFNNFYLSSTDDFIGTSDYENLYLDNILRYLDDYGGPTSTIRLPEGSRAIDNGNNTVCAAAGVNGVDQRGSARADGACDIGAFELNEATITLNDAGDNTGGCDLRNAILSANSGNSYGGCTAGRIYNTIAFDYNYFPYDANNSITLDGPLPRIRRNLLIEGQGASNLVIDANNTGRVFDIYEATVELVSLTLTGGNVADAGGGINAVTSKLILTDSSVSGNNASAGSGGGILVTTSSTLELENSTVSNNNSSNYGGGIYASGSMVSLANSTLSGNTANNDGGGIDAARSTVLNMTNSTVTGNEATNGSGGGIDAYEFADVTLVNTIVSGNTAGTAGNEISDFKNDSTFATNNNLFGDSNSTGTQAFKDFTPDASDYLATSDGGNGTFSPASILLPLGNNGGPTQTHALPEGSPALDKADPAGCQADGIEGEDQRGLPRNSVCDIGSFEFQRTITITVDSKADTSGGAKCTLRDAILSSNNNVAVGGCDAGDSAELIVFDPAVFPANGNNTINLTDYLPGIYNADVTITGRGKSGLTINANGVGSVLYAGYGSLTLNNINITGATRYGGLYFFQSDITLDSVSVFGNQHAYGGAGIRTYGGDLTISNSTISGNSTGPSYVGYGGYTYGNSGGGILANYAEVTLVNSTVSGNYASADGAGFDGNQIGLTLINSTVSGNTAKSRGGGLDLNGGSSTITNSIVAGNKAPTGAEISTTSYYYTAVLTTNNNLFADSSSTGAQAFSNFTPDASDINASKNGTNTRIDTILNELKNNGGPTMTHALTPGSPALNAASNANCGPGKDINKDQRGVNRNDGRCDIGAFEGFVDENTFYVIPLKNGKSVVIVL